MPDLSDEERFTTSLRILLDKGCARRRALSEAAYASLCRRVWDAARPDAVYSLKLLLDDAVPEQTEVHDVTSATGSSPPIKLAEPYCVLVARADPQGRLIDAPTDYSEPEDGQLRAVVRTGGSGIDAEESVEAAPAVNLVALFDVLGFENKLTEVGLSTMWQLYRGLVDTAVLGPNREKPWMKAFVTEQGEPAPLMYFFPARFAYFSDSILLWAPYEHPFVLQPFLLRCASMFCAALQHGLPLRGAISVGESVLHAGSSTFLGKPLVEAARLEQAQDWLGVSLGASFKQQEVLVPGLGTLIPYAAPLKAGRAELFSGLTLDWPRFWRRTRRDSASDFLGRLSTPAFARYYTNARDYLVASGAHERQEEEELGAQGFTRVADILPS